jgi:hypothetical protein
LDEGRRIEVLRERGGWIRAANGRQIGGSMRPAGRSTGPTCGWRAAVPRHSPPSPHPPGGGAKRRTPGSGPAEFEDLRVLPRKARERLLALRASRAGKSYLVSSGSGIAVPPIFATSSPFIERRAL